MRKLAVIRVLATLALLAFGTGLGLAEDIKGKWYFGGGLGVLVNDDNIRSNAALIIAPLGDDGAPFTGDKGEIVSCDESRADVFCDPRPDDLIARQTSIEDTLKLDAFFGYGLTSYLSLQLEAGYYEGDVRNFDVYTQKNVPESNNPLDPCIQLGQSQPCDLTLIREKKIKTPITAATVTEIPVSLSGVFRFRKDSNFNPYLGVGVGYVFTSADQSAEVDDLNERLENLHLIQVTDEFGVSYGRLLTQDVDGNAPFNYPAKVEVDDAFKYQVFAGGDYFFNDRMALNFDVRYVLTDSEINISMGSEDQINLDAWTEELYRADGSLRVFDSRGVRPNPIDPNSFNQQFRYDCDPDNDGLKNAPPADYDFDGQLDACFTPSAGQSGQLKETIVVQGGTIRLTHFAFGIGLKFHF